MIRFRSNGVILRRRLSDIGERQLPFATAMALTQTAKDGASAFERRLKRVLDRPKPFTLRATTIRAARKSRLIASVLIKDRSPVRQYLRALEEGGARKHKAFEQSLIKAGIMRSSEYAVPGRSMKLDRYGNITRAALTKIIAGVRSGGGSKRISYFVPTRGMQRGIYRRDSKGIRPVIIFVEDAPRYTAVTQFDETVIREARRRFPQNMRDAFAKAVRTAKR